MSVDSHPSQATTISGHLAACKPTKTQAASPFHGGDTATFKGPVLKLIQWSVVAFSPWTIHRMCEVAP